MDMRAAADGRRDCDSKEEGGGWRRCGLVGARCRRLLKVSWARAASVISIRVQHVPYRGSFIVLIVETKMASHGGKPSPHHGDRDRHVFGPRKRALAQRRRLAHDGLRRAHQAELAATLSGRGRSEHAYARRMREGESASGRFIHMWCAGDARIRVGEEKGESGRRVVET